MSNKSDTSVFEGEEENKQLSNKINNMQSSPRLRFNYQTEQLQNSNRQKSKSEYYYQHNNNNQDQQNQDAIQTFSQIIADTQNQQQPHNQINPNNKKESTRKLIQKSISQQDDDQVRLNHIVLQKNHSHNNRLKQLSSPIKPFKFHGLSSQSIYNVQAQADQDDMQNLSFSENIDESPQKVFGLEDSSQDIVEGLPDYQVKQSVLLAGMIGGTNNNTKNNANKILEQDEESKLNYKDLIMPFQLHDDDEEDLDININNNDEVQSQNDRIERGGMEGSLNLQQNLSLKQLQSNKNNNNNNSQSILESPQVLMEPDSIEFIEEEHFKIYEFRFNENNAKSVISSTDRKYPQQQTQQPQTIQDSEIIDQSAKHCQQQAQPNQFMTYNQKHFNKQLSKQIKSPTAQQNTLKQSYATSFASPGNKMPFTRNEQQPLRQNFVSSHSSTQNVSKLLNLATSGLGFINSSVAKINQNNDNFKNKNTDNGNINQKDMTEDIMDNEDASFEFEIKNLDTNEVFKMHVPVTQNNESTISRNQQTIPTSKIDLNYASKRKAAAASAIDACNDNINNNNGLIIPTQQDQNQNQLGVQSQNETNINSNQQNAQKVVQQQIKNTNANEKVEQQKEKLNCTETDFDQLKTKQYAQYTRQLHLHFDMNEDMRDGQKQYDSVEQQHQVDIDKTSLITQRNVKLRENNEEATRLIRQNTQKLLQLKKLSISQNTQQEIKDEKTVELQNIDNKLIKDNSTKDTANINNQDQPLIIPISDDRKLKLLKEIYTPVIASPSINSCTNYGEYNELLPQYYGEDQNENQSDKIVRYFDQLEDYYENMMEYSVTKHQYLQSFMDIQSTQIRKHQKKYKESNDIITCIRNSVAKHTIDIDLETYLSKFDVQKTRQNWEKCAMQLMPQNIKDALQAKIDQTNTTNALQQATFKVKSQQSQKGEVWDQKIGYIDPLGIYEIELAEHHVHIDERNFFSKMMWADKQKQEKEAKIEAYKVLREIIEIEMRKFELWNLYTSQVNRILNYDYFSQEESQIREKVYKEGLFGIFNPLIQE